MIEDGWGKGRKAATRRAIEGYWGELADVARLMPFGQLAAAAEALLACRERGRTVFLLGNGGSAATASHLACDLSKGTRTAGLAPFRVVALTDNVPIMTAWANDASYDRIFAEQVEALAQPGDVLVAISASGRSPNVLAAVAAARELGVTVVGLTGQPGGDLARLADLAIQVPAGSIELVEDAHLAVAHSLCVAIRARLRSEADARLDAQIALHPLAESAVADLAGPLEAAG